MNSVSFLPKHNLRSPEPGLCGGWLPSYDLDDPFSLILVLTREDTQGEHEINSFSFLPMSDLIPQGLHSSSISRLPSWRPVRHFLGRGSGKRGQRLSYCSTSTAFLPLESGKYPARKPKAAVPGHQVRQNSISMQFGDGELEAAAKEQWDISAKLSLPLLRAFFKLFELLLLS